MERMQALVKDRGTATIFPDDLTRWQSERITDQTPAFRSSCPVTARTPPGAIIVLEYDNRRPAGGGPAKSRNIETVGLPGLEKRIKRRQRALMAVKWIGALVETPQIALLGRRCLA